MIHLDSIFGVPESLAEVEEAYAAAMQKVVETRDARLRNIYNARERFAHHPYDVSTQAAIGEQALVAATREITAITREANKWTRSLLTDGELGAFNEALRMGSIKDTIASFAFMEPFQRRALHVAVDGTILLRACEQPTVAEGRKFLELASPVGETALHIAYDTRIMQIAEAEPLDNRAYGIAHLATLQARRPIIDVLDARVIQPTTD